MIMTDISISCNWNILTILEEGYFSTKMENWNFVWTLGFIGIYLICHINILYNGDANNVFHCSFVFYFFIFYSFILAGRAYYQNCQSKNLVQENVTRWLDGTEGQI